MCGGGEAGEVEELSVCGREAKWGGGCRLRCWGVRSVKENEGGPFYSDHGQLKGPRAAEEPQGRKFHYYSEIYALYQHLSCKIKKK